MAAIAVPQTDRWTSYSPEESYYTPEESRDVTTPLRPRPEVAAARPRRSADGHRDVRTFPEVPPEERGEENLQDRAGYSLAKVQPELVIDDDGESARLRSELARELLRRIDEIVPLVGDVALPTRIQLLKRELSRCHDTLGTRAAESGFLSIVTLVESALAQRKWRDFTPLHFEALRSAIELGYRQSRVAFEDYERVRRDFAAGDVDTNPRIDLECLNMDDVEDDEEE